MTNGTQAPAKKGLPVWAWISIGCGGLLILFLVIAMVVTTFIWNKGKGLVEEAVKNPELTVVRAALMANSEWEEVDADETARTITVRNTKTGEEITVNFEDIEDGKLSFTTDEGEVTVDASELEDSGSLSVTNDQGEVVFSTGETSAEDFPPWVPVYPGSDPSSRHSMKTEDSHSGGFEISTADPVADVFEFYRSELESAGYAVSVNTLTQDDTEIGMVNGSNEAEQRSVMVIVSAEAGGPTKAEIKFSDED